MKVKKAYETLKLKDPVKLDSGKYINLCEIAYKTFGKLNKNKSNAILVCHALSGDQYCTGINPITNKKGWWNILIGPGKVIDTNIFFVICCNVLGGCMGSTGPSSGHADRRRLQPRVTEPPSS